MLPSYCGQCGSRLPSGNPRNCPACGADVSEQNKASNNFYLYMNGQAVAHWSDGSYSAGGIGLIAGDNTHPTEVAFSDLRVWSI